MKLLRSLTVLLVWTPIACAGAPAAPRVARDDLPGNVDRIARAALAKSGVPSASIAAASNGAIVFSRAYGDARLRPAVPATPATRYPIGSISKQFTAAAVMTLVEEGKLALDDRVAKHLPDAPHGGEISIRQLLAHTSGLVDYAPEDYFVPGWEKPIEPREILARWAARPLDFEPGTRFRYANTNYVLAGLVVEKVAGRPLFALLEERFFRPLGMRSVEDSDRSPRGEGDAQGYFRYALGLHAAPKEGTGWMFAAGELAMTADDLARWDLAWIAQRALTPPSYRALETETLLADGAGTRYGLGVSVKLVNGRRVIGHGGEVSGFVAANVVMPDDGVAVAVLTNRDASSAAQSIADDVAAWIVSARDPERASREALVERAFRGLARGALERGLFTADANAYFTGEAVREIDASLRPLGAPLAFEEKRSGSRGGMTFAAYHVTCERGSVELSVYVTRDGKLQQLLVDTD